MSRSLDCPPLECWEALLDAALPPDQRERCERHLESCPACQEWIDRTEECVDSLRSLGRHLGDPTIVPADPTLFQFLEKLQEGMSLVRSAGVEPIDLGFLCPANKPGVLGTLGNYEVQGVIGQGGMGVVLKGYESELHRLVAIKVLAPALAGSRTARQRFTREAQAAAAIRHDHVVTVHAVQEAESLPYLVMQYVAGQSLQQRLDRGGPLAVEEVVRIGMQTAAGLAAAHAQGLIHRDIKPANLLLEGEPGASEPPGLSRRSAATGVRVKITDFGLARLAGDVGLTQAGVVAGTPEYMAPEQARGEPVDHRADLFSLGSVLYALCTGVPPFRGSSAMAVLRQVSDQAPTPIRSLNPEVPVWLEGLIGRLQAKDPGMRIQNAAEVAALLEGYLAHLRQPTMVAAPELPRVAGAKARDPGHPPWFSRHFQKGSFVLLTVLGLGLALWLAGFGGQMPNAGQEPKVFRQDFRGQKVSNQFLRYEPPDAGQQIKEEPEGLRITVPGNADGDDKDSWKIIGFLTRFRVHGDCEITLSYELLRADKPPGGKGYRAVGVSLVAVTDTPGREAALLARFHRADGQLYLCQKIVTDAAGKRQYTTKVVPTAVRSGKLRLVRRGDVFTYLVAENDAGEFRELQQVKLVANDLAHVRVAAETPNSVDIRIRDFEVNAQDLPMEEPPLPDANAPQKTGGRIGLFVAEVLGLVITLSLLIGLGVWLYARQRRRAGTMLPGAAAESEQAQPGAVSPSVSFSCSGCGKSLKARSELLGKKVKCPQCGRAVAVPRIETGEPG